MAKKRLPGVTFNPKTPPAEGQKGSPRTLFGRGGVLWRFTVTKKCFYVPLKLKVVHIWGRKIIYFCVISPPKVNSVNRATGDVYNPLWVDTLPRVRERARGREDWTLLKAILVAYFDDFDPSLGGVGRPFWSHSLMILASRDTPWEAILVAYFDDFGLPGPPRGVKK